MKTPGLNIAGAALTTPVNAQGRIDYDLQVQHALSLLQRGLDTLTLFGTTGEGSSFSLAEREVALRACADAGIKPEQLGMGVFSLSSSQAAEESRAAFANGCGYVLLAPPSYFKGVDDEGLYRWFSEVLEIVGSNRGQFVLYHIPALTMIEISVSLVHKLAAQYPQQIMGVKDSSGDWSYSERLINERGDLTVLIGHEGHLANGMKAGAAGSISGTSNFIPELIYSIVHDGLQDQRLIDLIEVLLNHPVVPAVKSLQCHVSGNPTWLNVKAPLSPLNSRAHTQLTKSYDALYPVG